MTVKINNCSEFGDGKKLIQLFVGWSYLLPVTLCINLIELNTDKKKGNEDGEGQS